MFMARDSTSVAERGGLRRPRRRLQPGDSTDPRPLRRSRPFRVPAAWRTMERAIARQGLAYTAHDYPGTDHWFAESDHRAFGPRAAVRAY